MNMNTKSVLNELLSTTLPPLFLITPNTEGDYRLKEGKARERERERERERRGERERERERGRESSVSFLQITECSVFLVITAEAAAVG